MSTNTQKRTAQVRIPNRDHRKLKLHSTFDGLKMGAFVVRALQYYYDRHPVSIPDVIEY